MGWVVNATPRPLYPRERPGTHCIGGWVVFRASLDRCGKSAPTGILSSDRPSRSESLYRLSYPGPRCVPMPFIPPHGSIAIRGSRLLHEIPRSPSDQPVTETSNWAHRTLTTDRHPCPPGRIRTLEHRKASARWTTPWTARPLGTVQGHIPQHQCHMSWTGVETDPQRFEFVDTIVQFCGAS